MSKSAIIPVVVACITYERRILLIRRVKEPFAGQWSLPGGKIEMGEFPVSAMNRELKEETGLLIPGLDCMGLVCEIISDVQNNNKILYHHLVYVYKGCSDSMPQMQSDEGILKWFMLEDVLEMENDLVATDREIIKNMLIAGINGLFNSTVVYAKPNYLCTDFSTI